MSAGEMSAGEMSAGEVMPELCDLTPAQVEGPFYFPIEETRVEMAVGQAGVPLQLSITVQNDNCDPIPDALVEVWHADAAGIYSGFGGQAVDTTGQDFLRGEGNTAASGEVTFLTIYPGWYPGRAVHIHLKVSVNGSLKLTSQLYLPDEISRQVYLDPSYNGRGEQDTSLEADGILSRTIGRDGLVADVEPNNSGYHARLHVTV